MLSLTYLLVFIFCTAVTAGAVLIGHRFISTYNTSFARDYFYCLVSFYAFAVYGIWGNIMVREVLTSWDTEAKVVLAVASFLPILGIPFLFISWIVLVRSAYSLIGKNIKISWLIFQGMFLISVLVGVWFFFTLARPHQWIDREQLIRYEVLCLSAIDAVYFLIFSLIILSYLRKQTGEAAEVIRGFVLLSGIGMLMRESLLVIFFDNQWIFAAAVFLYFASAFIPLFYLDRQADKIFKPVGADLQDPGKLDRLIKKFGISKREREIVEQICSGKTNGQIADELFISLQTVKDHTHRIYTKMGINSRMKLVQMVKLD